MPKERDYLVRFASAERSPTASGPWWQIAISDWFDAPVHSVRAATLADLEQAVRRLAAAEQRHVAPSIRLRDSTLRKPTGFDALCKRLHVIEYTPVPAGWTEVEA